MYILNAFFWRRGVWSLRPVARILRYPSMFYILLYVSHVKYCSIALSADTILFALLACTVAANGK